VDVRNAYFVLAKKYHPDRIGIAPTSSGRKIAEDLFAKITEAQSVLKTDATRKEYDAKLELEAGGGAGSAEAQAALESEIAFQKGTILVRKGDFPGAIEFLKKATELYGQEAEYHLWLGWALHRNASKTKNAQAMRAAKAEIEAALNRNDRMPQGHFFLGLIAKSEGDTERARHHFEKTIQLDPRHTEANSELRILNIRQTKAASGGLKNLFKKKEA
jgi:curved DNA-binding protein CbpA